MQMVARVWRAILAFSALRCTLASHVHWNSTALMFWRFQKVGSTTLASMITTYAVRHEKAVKHRIGGRELRCIVCRDMFECDSNSIPPKDPIHFSLWHESCDRLVPVDRLKQVFGLPHVQEIAMFRDPVDRAVSAYYFWGEIAKYKMYQRFQYHGNMSEAAPYDMAMAYAANPKYMRGAPGPTYSSTFWASTVEDSISIMNSRIFVLILEQFDESLILLRDQLNWKLADLVHMKVKRAKPHAKAADWPKEAIAKLQSTLFRNKEYAMYNAARDKFDRQLSAFPGGEQRMQKELEALKFMRVHVERLCSDMQLLKRYHAHLHSMAQQKEDRAGHEDIRMQQSCAYRKGIENLRSRQTSSAIKHGGLVSHVSLGGRPSKATSLFEDKDEMNNLHMFSYYSFPVHASDLCSSCEAHALQWAMQAGYTPSKLSTISLADVPDHVRQSLPEFRNCPAMDQHVFTRV